MHSEQFHKTQHVPSTQQNLVLVLCKRQYEHADSPPPISTVLPNYLHYVYIETKVPTSTGISRVQKAASGYGEGHTCRHFFHGFYAMQVTLQLHRFGPN